MKKRVADLRHEAGFTLIEVMVGIFLLLLGVLGVATMADQANISSSQSKARVGATNLARELLEDTRSFKYADLQGTVPSGSGSTDLEDAYAGIGVTDSLPSTTGFQVSRRGITYNVSIFTCVLDDRHDGVRAAPSSGPDVNASGPYCLGSPTPGSGSSTDANPDDARKLEVNVTWSVNGITASCRGANQTSTSGPTGGQGVACVTQSQLIANPSGGLGPAIKTLVQANPGTVESGTNAVAMNVTTASPAQSVTWTADNGASGPATQSGTDGTQWTFTWNLGANSPSDGPHLITAQAFLLNAGGVPKEVSVTLNRFIPAVPTGGTGGIDTRSGEAAVISWSPNSDQDIFGYTVYRAVDANPPNLTSSPKDQPVCSTTSVSSTLCFDAPSDLQSFATNAACIDPVEQANGDKCINYYVVAFDSRWTTTTNPTTYNGTLCPGLPWSPSVDVPAPPVPASSSTAPITSSSLWGTARAGCPSAFISIDYTTHSSNQQPAAPSSLTCTTDSGQPVIGWTPPPSPDGDGDEIASYRIYRDPVGGGAPQYNDPATTIGYNLGTTNSYKDSAPTGGTGHDYWITAVDARFQESAAVHIAWTAASCP